MHLWDALCHCLRVRDVSVEDVSSKKGMLLRVLLPIANKSTFYMQHGYTFGRGQFHVQEHDWQEAVEKLRRTELDDLLLDFENVDEMVQKIIWRYSKTDTKALHTLGDLLNLMFFLSENEGRALHFGLQYLARPEPNAHERSAFMAQIKKERQVANGVCCAVENEERVADPMTTVSEAIGAVTLESTGVVAAPLGAEEAVMDACVGESDRETERSPSVDGGQDGVDEGMIKTPRKHKKSMPLDDPGDLIRPEISPFDAASLFEGSRKYSATKMVEIIRITLGVLQVRH